jgi:pSer/pThr/pTyr-binding forkhead associated (FHA) protein
MITIPAKLVALRDDIRPGQYSLESEACIIGRAELCHIVHPIKTVSRLHAIIERDEETNGYVLRDHHSANGTYVNGRRLRERHQLVNHDQIGLGTPTAQLCFEVTP